MTHDHACPHRSTGGALPRRRALRGGGALAAVALAGCLGGGGGDAPDPVALTGGLQCDVCGMVIEKHPGPDGQVFFQSNEPAGHAPPARFDALKQCLFPYLFEHRAMGWNESAVYVTDYSAVDYTVSQEGDTRVISSHPEAAAFAEATDLHFVVGSSVRGAMGPDFVPFSERAAADDFAVAYGGEVVGFGDIGEAVVGR